MSAGTALITVMYMIGLLDYCINKIMPCGEVCLTLNTLTIFFAGLIYHIVATVYGVVELFWGKENACVELVMFKKITGWIYVSWFFFVVVYVIGKWLWLSKKKEIRTVEEDYTELK